MDVNLFTVQLLSGPWYFNSAGAAGRPISGDLVKAYVSSVYDDVNHNVPEHVLQVQGNEEEDATVCMKF